jgi:hypothetical protein
MTGRSTSISAVRTTVVGRSNHAQQVAHVIEQPVGAFFQDDRAEHRGGNVRFTYARWPDEAQSLLDDGKRRRELLRAGDRGDQPLVRIEREVVEVAPGVPGRNARFVDQLGRQGLAPAVAPFDPAHAVSLHGTPSGAVAACAGHE